MKIEDHETPKILLEIESKLKEHCRDWFLAVHYENKIYWLKSTDYGAFGLGKLCLESIKKEFTGEVPNDIP